MVGGRVATSLADDEGDAAIVRFTVTSELLSIAFSANLGRFVG